MMLVASGCGGGTTPTGTALNLSADQLLARLIERGDTAGFSKTADFGETCAQYLAGTERHQLVIGYEMLGAMRDVELAARGLPFADQGGEPADSPAAEPFRVGVVSRCGQQASDLVRQAASIEYIANHVTYSLDTGLRTTLQTGNTTPTTSST
jgi:hypothetical protein